MDPFDYHLPPERIAQAPVEPRDAARLLVVERATGQMSHRRFFELADLLSPGDLLILNDTRVLPARVLGKRAATGGKWEGLYLQTLNDGSWQMLCKAGGKPKPGEIIDVDELELVLEENQGEGRWRVRPKSPGSPMELLSQFGQMPLPPYIRKGLEGPGDRERYQTVYADRPGAVAAPTAGLHFTPALFERLASRGIEKAFVTLHVGLGTFQPIQVDDIRQHPMHAEWCELSDATVQAIEACKKRGGRVVAVGTTSVRVLETVAQLGPLKAWSGETRLFIHEPYSFRVVDALITNFHLPRTTLLLLVAALTGVELLTQVYAQAIAEEYRFYSYGDAMLIA